MNSNFELALQLLGIGMITVFIILLLVVLIGNVIVRVVNKYMPEAEVVTKKVARSTATIDPRKVSAIVAAIQAVTNGNGKVANIEKI